MVANSTLTGIERPVHDDEIIVSKTDAKGRITYCNDVFIRLAGYSERELIGQAHNIIRHPSMPRCIFKLLWETIASGKELFAYVVNRSKNGDHYWVLAHVTPDFDASGAIIGYHSFRRSTSRAAIAVVEQLYARLLAEEGRHAERKVGQQAASALLATILADKGISYDEFVLSL